MLDHSARTHRARWTLVAILLCAFALRLLNLTAQPLWFDEGWSVWFATADLPAMAARTAADIHPPLYYALLHLWIGFAGTGEFALRLCSVLLGVLFVACVYGFTRTLLDNTSATLAAMLAALSPLYVFYAQEIRMYGLVTLFGLISTWMFWKALQAQDTGSQANQWKWWLIYVLATGAAMYTQYYGAFILLFHFAYALLTIRKRLTFLYALVSWTALFLLYLPWLLYVTTQLTQYVADKVGEERYLSLSLGDYLARHAIAFSVGHLNGDVTWLGWAALLFIALIAIGARWLLSRRNSILIFLTLYLLVPLIAGYLIQLRFPFAPPRMERLLLLASPPFILLAARGLAALALPQPQARARYTARAGFAVMLVACTVSLLSFYAVPRYPEQDYRPLAAHINALAMPEDVVVLVHPWQVGFMRAYLSVPLTLQPVGDPAWGDTDRAALDRVLRAQRRVWLPAYHALGALLETAMEKFLAQHALLVTTEWQHTTLLSFYAPAQVDSVRALRASFGDWSLEQVATSDRELEAGWGIVPLQFGWRSRVQAPAPHLSLRLRDAQGRVWAAQDRELIADDGRDDGSPRSDSFLQNVGFLIPAGTPPNAYQLMLSVYDAQAQQPLGAELSLGAVHVVAPAVAPPVAALSMRTAYAADWPQVRLLGYTLREGIWQAGELMQVDLFWQALATASAATLFVQVQDAQGQPVVSNAELLRYGAGAWRPGELMREQRELLLPAKLVPGRYKLVIGWSQVAQRINLTSGGDQLVLREVEVKARAHQFTTPAIPVRRELRFADIAQLSGYALALDAPHHSLDLRLYWRASKETDTSYKVFVHIVAPDSLEPIAQHDSLPANGQLPTTTWVPGEYIVDEHVLQLPDLSPGTYRVLVGLYDSRSGARVRAYDSDGHEFQNDAAALLTFEAGG